ncbi:MAG TPA: glycosyltransferase family 1 protein, partial [Polyangia bacterium]|nr:glycosyltransferase family 1 protein [Polyangia bacterium]
MKRLRIAFVVCGSIDQVSGGYIYDRALIAALRAAGHQVDVCELPRRRYLADVAESVARAGSRKVFPGARAPADYDAAIHDELIHPAVFLSEAGDARLPRGKLVLALVHNLRCNQPSERLPRVKTRVERRYLSTVDGVVAVCARTLDDARALAGGSLPGVVVHPGRDHVRPTLDGPAVIARCHEPG